MGQRSELTLGQTVFAAFLSKSAHSSVKNSQTVISSRVTVKIVSRGEDTECTVSILTYLPVVVWHFPATVKPRRSRQQIES